MNIDIIDIFVCIFDIAILIIFFNAIFAKRNEKVSYPIFFCCFILAQIVDSSSGILFNLSTDRNLVYIITITNIITSFLLTFLYIGNLKIRFFTAISYQIFGGLAENTIYTIFSLLPQNMRKLLLTNNPICLASSKIVLFIFVTAATLILKKKRKGLLSAQYSFLVLFMPILTIFILITIPDVSNPDTFHKLLNMIAIIGLMATNVINYFLLDNILKVHELEISKNQLNDQLEYQSKKYLLLSTTYKNSRSIIHDTKKHYYYIIDCLHRQSYDEIEDYLENSINEMEVNFNRINTGNLVIDAFVSNHQIVAEQNNIIFKTNIQVDLDNIQIEDYDFSIILGNLLDNCYNACTKIMAPKRREIDVEIYTTDRELVIHLSNTFNPDTTKYSEHELVHGFGTANINNIAIENHGTYSNFIDKNMYHAVVTIPCNIDIHRGKPVNKPVIKGEVYLNDTSRN